MRTTRALINFRVDIIITFILVALGFYLRTIFITRMGDDLTGVMLLFTQLMAYLNLAELGVGIAIASLLYEPLSKKDYARVKYICDFLEVVYKYIMLLVLFIGFIIGFCIYFFIDSVSVIKNIYWYWSLFVINTALTYTYAKYSTLLTANQLYSDVRKIQGGGKIIVIIVQLLVIAYSKSFWLYLLTETVGVMIQYCIFRKRAAGSFEFDKIKSELNQTEHNEIKISIFKKIKNVLFHKIGGVLVFNTDYILVSKFLNLKLVTIYGSYMMVFQIVNVLTAMSVNAVTAGMGNFLISETKKNIKELISQLYVFFIALGTFIVVLMYYLLDDFILNWIGKEYLLDKHIIILMLINVFINLYRVPCDIVKNASGIFGDIYYPIIEGVINLIFSAFLAYYYGLSGIIIGTIISNVIITLCAKPLYLYARVFEQTHSVIHQYISLVIQPIICSIISIGLFTLSKQLFIPQWHALTWPAFILKTILYSVIMFIYIIAIFSVLRNFRAFIKRILRSLLS